MDPLIWDDIYTADEITAVDIAYDTIDDLFLSDNMRTMDRALRELDISRARVSVTLSVLTATLKYAALLPSRPSLIARLREKMSADGLSLVEIESTLRGLDEPSI